MSNQEHDNVVYHIHRHKKLLVVHTIVLLVMSGIFIFISFQDQIAFASQRKIVVKNVKAPVIATTTQMTASSSLLFTLTKNPLIEETGSLLEVGDKVFWLSSGAKLFINNGIAQTIQKELLTTDKWYLTYKLTNSTDTDGGVHPQNLFRLVTRSLWNNSTQEMYFSISKLNKSSSPNRNASNGVLFFSRYFDSQSLYYAGIRVDGTAVIKKKVSGTYYTLAQTKILPGVYDINTNANLLPINTWLGIKLKTETLGKKVVLTFYFDDGKGFSKVLEAIDDGISYRGGAFINSGKVGIRTDFLDVLMKDYSVTAF